MEQPKPNFHSTHEERRDLKKTLNTLGVEVTSKGIEKILGEDDTIEPKGTREKAKSLLRKAVQKARQFKLADFGGITKAKQRLRADREELISKNKVDIEAVMEEMSDKPSFVLLITLHKELKTLKKARNKRIIQLKNQLTQRKDKDQVLDELNQEIEETEKQITRIAVEEPNIKRAYNLLNYKEGLSKEGRIAEVLSVIDIQQQIEDKMIEGKPMLLWGPTGTGKTSIAKKVARDMTGKTAEIVYCNPETKQSEIFGHKGLEARDGASVTVDIYGQLAKAAQEGNVCIFDEFTALAEGQSVFIKGILSSKPGDKLSIPGNGTITIREGFQLIFTANLKSDKNKERQEMPPEIANEFGQNNIYVGYQSKEESTDITITKLLNKDCSIDISKYDLEKTIPTLTTAIREIQDAYTTPIATQRVGELKYATTSGFKPPQLKKLVLNQRTIDNIVTGFQTKRLKGDTQTFIEYLDQRLKKELTFAEYPLEDRILTAKILSIHGLLTTLTDKDLDLPVNTLIRPTGQTPEQLQQTTEQSIEKSRDVIHLTLKELVGDTQTINPKPDVLGQAASLMPNTTPPVPETAQTPEKIANLDIQEAIKEFQGFYTRHNISIPANFEQQSIDIWNRNKTAIEQAVQTEGYDTILIIPDTIPSTGQPLEELHTKMTEGYVDTFQSANFTGGGSFAGCITNPSNTEQNQFRLVLVHSAKELDDHPKLKETINQSAEQLKADGKEGLSLPEYLILQREFFEKTNTHMDSTKWTRLPKSQMTVITTVNNITTSEVMFPLCNFFPVRGWLGVRALLPSDRYTDLGCRLSRSFL